MQESGADWARTSVGRSSAARLAPAAPAEVPARSVGTAPAAAYRVSPLFGRRNSVVRTGDSLVAPLTATACGGRASAAPDSVTERSTAVRVVQSPDLIQPSS